MSDHRPIVCCAIHGILTGQTRASWPDEFDAWAENHHRDTEARRRIHVVKKEYSAGPFPRLNWFKNRRIAEGLVREVELFQQRKNGDAVESVPTKIWFVAHSNGAVIALEAARRLIAEGFKVEGLILTGAACESDVGRNGVLSWSGCGQVGKAVSLSSAEDGVVNTSGFWRWLKWPYGDLGRVGWQLDGRPFRTSKVYTLWRAGGHSGYFARERVEDTFDLFWRLMDGEVAR